MKNIKLVSILLFMSFYVMSQSIDWEQEFHDGYGNPLFTGGMSYSNPCFADIDNDGDYDCFMGCDAGTIIFYENTGSASSAEWHYVTNKYNDIYFPQISKSNVSFVDIDNDGDLDMFFGGGTGSNETGIFYYRNDGNANDPDWVFVTDKYMNIETNPTSIYNYCKTTFADMDNDGDFDLLFGNYKKDIYYENVGDAENPDFILADDDYFDFGGIGYWNFHNPTFTDIDGDEDYDCFIGTTNTHFLFFENTGSPETAVWNLVTEEYIDITSGEQPAPAFCDLDNDQDYDMFIGLNNGKNLFYENNSIYPGFEWIYVTDNPITLDIGFNSNIAFADIYGNDLPSLFINKTGLDLNNNRISEYKNSGTQAEPLWNLETTSFFNIHYPDDWINSLCFADIDNDMDLDLFIGLGFDNKIMVHYNLGDSENPDFDSTGVAAFQFEPAGNIMFNPALVDIDADMDLDMFISAQESVMGYDAMIWFYENTGTPELPAWELGYMMASQWGKLAFMDEDGDGDLDVLYSGYLELFQEHDSLYLYENTGDIYNPEFNLANTNYLPVEMKYFSTITLYDTDNDNDPDLYLGGDKGGIYYYKNKGLIQTIEDHTGNLTGHLSFTCYPNPASISDELTIEFVLEKQEEVCIKLYNEPGRELRIIMKATLKAGKHNINWPVKSAGITYPGIYFLYLRTGTETNTKKVIIKQ